MNTPAELAQAESLSQLGHAGFPSYVLNVGSLLLTESR
jgi:hypothetical protein